MNTHPLLPDKLILTGGRQRREGYEMKEWTGYDRAIALSLSKIKDKCEVRELINYQTPAECLPDDEQASITFKSGTLSDSGLWIATQTEVLLFDQGASDPKSVISLPEFNDVHHVFQSATNTLVVTSTGLDAVFEYSLEGDLINEWSCSDNKLWEKFDKSRDYRHVLTTKPHASHPNYCLEYNGQYWATRLKQKDTICLQSGLRIDLSGELLGVPTGQPHDGILVGQYAYFTHVNGFLSRVDMEQKKVVEITDLNEFNESSQELGWCRGLYYIDEDNFIIGFTRIRPSKFHQGLEWLKTRMQAKGWRGSLPTRICLVNTRQGKFEWQLDLEPHAINAIFSIL